MSNSAGGPLAIGEAFGRYHVIRLLGMGGMGAVYHAWDQELGVAVALKVIRPEATADPAAAADMERRFKRELLLARQVTHANVVRIHDLGELDGIKYITMTYIEGEDLATRLRRGGKLVVGPALVIARQIVSGLAAAHAAGVVHRDLKPANIMIDGSLNALIMDFGIARSASAPAAPPPHGQAPPPGATFFATPTAAEGATTFSPPTADEGATIAPAIDGGFTEEPVTIARGARLSGAVAFASIAQGAIVGTIEYMAPEQAKGQAVDHRADSYAFGMILSEMLIGRRPVAEGLNPIEALRERIQAEPTSLQTVDPAIPEAVDAIAMRCLQVDPAKRFETTEDLAAAFDRLDDQGVVIPEARRLTRPVMAAAALAVTVLVGATYWTARPRPAPAVPAPVSVLIATFNNKTGDPVFDGVVEQALGLGIEGASFITEYPRRDALRAAAVIKPGGTLDEGTARLVAVREGVGLILSGDIETRGSAYRITARVLSAASESAPLNTLSANASSKAVLLETVGALAGRVRTALGDTEVPEGGPAANETFTAANLEAARAYAEGQELQASGKRLEAIEMYAQAIQLDPEMGRAYAGAAVQFSNLNRFEEAEKYYQEALARIDRMTDREKYRTRGGYYLWRRKGPEAVQEYAALLKAFPGDTVGPSNLALAWFYSRNMEQALEQGRKAASLTTAVFARSNLALYAMYAGQFETAITESGEVLTLYPKYETAFVARALAEIGLGRTDEAVRTYGTLKGISDSGASWATSGLADLALYRGRIKEAIGLLRDGIRADLAAKNVGGAALKRVALADSHLAAGDTTSAAREAEQALAGSRSGGVVVMAGLALARAGRTAAAVRVADGLAERLEADPQAYARLVRAELSLLADQPRAALDHAKQAQQLADTWLGRVILARCYLALGAFAEATSELDAATKRQGEAMALMLDEQPTSRYFPPVFVYRGLAQEGLKSPAAHESFAAFLAIKKDGDETGGLVADARKRLAR